MGRTTELAVSKIISIEGTDVNVLTPFIETATNLVDRVCVPLGYDAVTLELIERWLAAHFYAIRAPRAAREKIGQAEKESQHKVDLHLDVTTYGQQVMLLDTEGGLAKLSKGIGGTKASVRWLGTART